MLLLKNFISKNNIIDKCNIKLFDFYNFLLLKLVRNNQILNNFQLYEFE